MSNDEVDHPQHYGGDTVYEAIKVIEAWGLGFSLGNAVKYIARAGKKAGSTLTQDLKKARWYLDREIERLEAQARLVTCPCLNWGSEQPVPQGQHHPECLGNGDRKLIGTASIGRKISDGIVYFDASKTPKTIEPEDDTPDEVDGFLRFEAGDDFELVVRTEMADRFGFEDEEVELRLGQLTNELSMIGKLVDLTGDAVLVSTSSLMVNHKDGHRVRWSGAYGGERVERESEAERELILALRKALTRAGKELPEYFAATEPQSFHPE